MKLWSLFTIIALCPSLFSAQSALDGFMKPKGQLDMAISTNMETANGYLAADSVNPITFNSNTIGSFFSFGTSDKTNVIATLPVINGEVQDLGLFFKYNPFGDDLRLGEGPFRANIGGGINLPVGGYNTQEIKFIGQGNVQAIGIANAQWHFHEHVFINSSIRYNISGNDIPSYLGLAGKIGYLSGKWYADAWYESQSAHGGEDYTFPDPVIQMGLDDPFINRVAIAYSRLGGTVYHQSFEKLGFFLGGGLILDGRNVWDITRVTLGLNYTPIKY